MTTPRNGRIKYYNSKRRTIMLAGDDIDSVTLFDMCNWICSICAEKIERHRRCPDKWAATVDHIIPLSLGGLHVWENVAAAHAHCNFKKAALVVKELTLN